MRERAKETNSAYIRVFGYFLFGLFPVKTWHLLHCRGLADRFAIRRTWLVRRDSLPHLAQSPLLERRER
jgi:hypothetical protein